MRLCDFSSGSFHQTRKPVSSLPVERWHTPYSSTSLGACRGKEKGAGEHGLQTNGRLYATQRPPIMPTNKCKLFPSLNRPVFPSLRLVAPPVSVVGLYQTPSRSRLPTKPKVKGHRFRTLSDHGQTENSESI